MKRILLIGLGLWGANHLRVLKSMPIELFVAEHDEKRLNSAEIPEDHRSKHARALFSRIDAAVVVTSASAHFEICRDLLEMGKTFSWKSRLPLSRTRRGNWRSIQH